MKNKIITSSMIFLLIFLNFIPVFATEFDDLPVWSDTSTISVPVSSEPSFDIASEAGILIEVTTRKSLI